jgi:methyltransferase (TIGR00027 family)
MPDATPISHVSDTAHWVAIYRAMESERPDALFRDPHARRLAGARGEEIVRTMPRGRSWAWPMIVRTAVMDEIMLRAVSRDGVRTVVNLAAGLDTRPYRLDLPATLRWFDVDFPDVQQYKRDAVAGEAPRCHLEWAPADLSDAAARQAVLERVTAAGGPGLVIAEGLLIYLTPEQVSALARDLHACPALSWWLIDIASPAQDDAAHVGTPRRGRRGAVPVRARRGHGLLRACGLARSGIPVELGRVTPTASNHEAGLALESGGPALPETQAGGGPADGRNRAVAGDRAVRRRGASLLCPRVRPAYFSSHLIPTEDRRPCTTD